MIDKWTIEQRLAPWELCPHCGSPYCPDSHLQQGEPESKDGKTHHAYLRRQP